MRKLIRYLLRDKVDLIMLGFTLMFSVLFFIKTPDVTSTELAKEGNYSIWLPVLCLFILGSGIWTKGTMMDLLNTYVTNPEYRLLLHLDQKSKRSPVELVIDIFFGLVMFAVFIWIFVGLVKL